MTLIDASTEGQTEGRWSAWAEAWQKPRFRVACAVTGTALAGALSILSVTLTHVERRSATLTLDDPVLSALAPHDFTWLTFGVIYLGLALGLAHLAPSPHAVMHGVRAYTILILLRSLTMTLTPLAPPAGMILLSDPFAEHVVAAHALTKDLFFSGHTSTMFLVFLAVRGRELKAFFGLCTLVVGVCVLWQHVHYTIDVVAAPAFAYFAYALARKITPASR